MAPPVLSSPHISRPFEGWGGQAQKHANRRFPFSFIQDDNFDRLVADGEWLVAVVAPWCTHCKQLEPVWRAVAAKLAGTVHVATVDSTKQKALTARFGVRAFPSIYFLRAGEAFEYGARPRTEDEIVAFATGGWADADPLPSHRAPNSRVGRALGALASAPSKLARAYVVLHRQRGWPALAAVGALLAGPVAAGLAFVALLDIVTTRRAVAAAKRARAAADAAARPHAD